MSAAPPLDDGWVSVARGNHISTGDRANEFSTPLITIAIWSIPWRGVGRITRNDPILKSNFKTKPEVFTSLQDINNTVAFVGNWNARVGLLGRAALYPLDLNVAGT